MGLAYGARTVPSGTSSVRAPAYLEQNHSNDDQDFACMSQSLYTVSLYDTLGPTAIEFISKHAELPSIVTSLNHIPVLFSLKPRLPHLKIIICLDSMDAGERPGHSKLDILSAIGSDLGVAVYSLAAVEALGESLGSVKFNPPTPDDIITINYTSGTTGDPKGVVLSHRTCIAAVSTSACTAALDPSDTGLSYLPLAHIYGRMVEQALLFAGGSIGFFHGNILELVDDLKLLRPTSFYSVPRLYNRFGGAIRANTTEQSGFRGALSRHIVSAKLDTLKDPDAPAATNKHALYDRIWGRKVSAAIGLDRTRIMVSGSAPLDPTLHRFLRVVFGNHFLQGFGMTETYAVGLAQLYGDQSAGNCGAVGPAHEVCLLSVPEMDYLVTDRPHPRGEMLMRGHTLFSGYYKNEAETAKSFLPGGWFRTGDIATIDDRGRVAIIDRRKNVLKLAQGEYVSPERLENVYLAALSYLATAFVHGDSLQTALVGVFGVAPDRFAPFAAHVLGRPIAVEDTQALKAACAHEKVRRAVQADLDKVGKRNQFAGFEKVKAATLMMDPFTIENDMLTPT